MKLDKPIDIQVFFTNGDKSFIHKNVTEMTERDGWLLLIKTNGLQAIVRSDNVTQILEV